MLDPEIMQLVAPLPTVRLIRENNLVGRKALLATPANYSAIAPDPDFIAGWSSAWRNSYFPGKLAGGASRVVFPPQFEELPVDRLAGTATSRKTAITCLSNDECFMPYATARSGSSPPPESRLPRVRCRCTSCTNPGRLLSSSPSLLILG